MSHKLQALLIAAVLGVSTLGLAACDSNDGPAEEAGESLDNATDNAGDAMGDAADNTSDAMDNAADETSDAMDNAGDEMDDATDDHSNRSTADTVLKSPRRLPRAFFCA